MMSVLVVVLQQLCFSIVLWCCCSTSSSVLFVSSFVPLWNYNNNYYLKRVGITPSTRGVVSLSMVNFLDLNNRSGGNNDASFTETKLVELAKSIFATDLGIANPSLLSSDFVFLSSALDSPLGKTDYVAAGRFFDLRSAFSDLDYRPHDFRIVPSSDARTSCVRCTMRVTGTMRGNLRLRDGVLPPTGRTMVCPPEAVTMVFENVADDPKLAKLCTFVIDNGVGNTEGTTGVMAASIIAGKRVSPWEISPPWTVVTRFVGRPIPPAEKKNVFLAPFPESVMISLAKGIIASEMGYNDPTLLSEDFIYSTPIVNVRKAQFLEQFARLEFAGVTPNFSNFRIDPYYPVRVWVDLQPTAEGYMGHPQAMSFTFDEDGYCTRVTSSYVMDVSVGNGGGLGGPEGYKYATKDKPSPFFMTRPWPRVLGRVQKFITSPVTGVGVDDYRLPGAATAGQQQEQTPEESDEATKAFSIPSLSVTTPPPPPPLPRKPEGEAKPSVPVISIPSFNLSPPLAKPTSESAPAKPKPSPSISIPSFSLGPKSSIPKPPPKQAKTTPSIKIPSLSLGPRPLATKPPPKQSKAPIKSTPTPSIRIPSLSLGPKPPLSKPTPKVQVKKTPSITIPSLSLGPKPPATKPPPKTEAESRLEQLKDFAGSIRIVPPAPELSKADQVKAKAAEEQKKREAAAAAKKREVEMKKRQEEAKKRELEIKKQQAAAEQAIAKAAELRKRQAGEKRAEAAKLAEQQKRQKAADEQKAAAAAAKAASEEARKQKRQAEEDQKAAAAAAKKSEAARKQQEASTQKPLVNLAAGFSRTISLFGMGKAELEELPAATTKSTPSAAAPSSTRPVKTAPLGVPKLTRWRRNSDGTITGLVSGSRGFEEGQRITTSPIASGTVAAGEVVKTGSGSRYFLE